MSNNIKVYSIWECEQYRNGILINSWKEKNVVTKQGLDYILNAAIRDAGLANWYVAIFKTDTTPDEDTTYQVPVFTESDDYDELTRPAYTTNAASTTKSLTNSSAPAEFTMDATVDIYGATLVGGTDADTKLDVSAGNVMFSASKFSSVKSFEANDVLKVTITISSANAA